MRARLPGSGSTPPAATARASAAVTVTAGTPSAPAGFAAITEPFDPGHPARVTKAPADCGSQDTTLAIEQCFEGKTETADAAIDALRQSAYARASATQRAAINAQDKTWLAGRAKACAQADQGGGTISGINAASCLLDESSARLASLGGHAPTP